jgi:hypothetical protein
MNGAALEGAGPPLPGQDHSARYIKARSVQSLKSPVQSSNFVRESEQREPALFKHAWVGHLVGLEGYR